MDSDKGNAVYLKTNNGHPFFKPLHSEDPVLGYHVTTSNRFPTFRDKSFFVDVSTIEDEATTFRRKVEIRWPIDASSGSKSTESSAARLRKTQNLKTHPFHCV